LADQRFARHLHAACARRRQRWPLTANYGVAVSSALSPFLSLMTIFRASTSGNPSGPAFRRRIAALTFSLSGHDGGRMKNDEFRVSSAMGLAWSGCSSYNQAR
jgi:hypothetical protein